MKNQFILLAFLDDDSGIFVYLHNVKKSQQYFTLIQGFSI